jgi:heme iron utilization protein
MRERTSKELLSELLNSQLTGVLATERDHQPYTNLVAFSFSDDLKRIFFATPINTTKYKNLTGNPQVSLLIDTRKNNYKDFSGSTAITVLGACKELSGNIKNEMLKNHLARLPDIRDFLSTSLIAAFEITVFKYIVTSGLDSTMVLLP